MQSIKKQDHLGTDGSGEAERHGRTGQRHEDGLSIVAKLFSGESLRVGLHALGDGEGDRCAADVTVGSDGGAGDLVAGSRPGETRLAGIAGLALGECDSQVRLVECDHGPVDEADELLYNGLYPGLEDRDAGRYAVDGDGIDTCRIVVSISMPAKDAGLPWVRRFAWWNI